MKWYRSILIGAIGVAMSLPIGATDIQIGNFGMATTSSAVEMSSSMPHLIGGTQQMSVTLPSGVHTATLYTGTIGIVGGSAHEQKEKPHGISLEEVETYFQNTLTDRQQENLNRINMKLQSGELEAKINEWIQKRVEQSVNAMPITSQNMIPKKVLESIASNNGSSLLAVHLREFEPIHRLSRVNRVVYSIGMRVEAVVDNGFSIPMYVNAYVFNDSKRLYMVALTTSDTEREVFRDIMKEAMRTLQINPKGTQMNDNIVIGVARK